MSLSVSNGTYSFEKMGTHQRRIYPWHIEPRRHYQWKNSLALAHASIQISYLPTPSPGQPPHEARLEEELLSAEILSRKASVNSI